MRKLPDIGYFWGLPHLHFIGVEGVEADVEADVEDTKVGRILGRKCVIKYFGTRDYYVSLIRYFWYLYRDFHPFW